MLLDDKMTAWLKAEVIECTPGFCKLEMVTRSEMANGFGIIHGSITFALADSAIAFAANAHGRHAVSLNTSIRHLEPVKIGDTLVAEAIVTTLKHRIVNVDSVILNQSGVRVADVRAMGYRKKEEW
ncbi:MAG: thioesterase [Bacteroidetes bacterium]|nr:MAG: thioesterase [Bacteroidota bacterium]